MGNNPIAGSPGYLGPWEQADPAKHGEMGKEEADRAREAWEILGKTVYGACAKGEDEDHVRDVLWQPSLRAMNLAGLLRRRQGCGLRVQALIDAAPAG